MSGQDLLTTLNEVRTSRLNNPLPGEPAIELPVEYIMVDTDGKRPYIRFDRFIEIVGEVMNGTR
jgi:hypothetical protein